MTSLDNINKFMDSITYEYDCGCKATYTKYEVLHLEVEPNWGCNECGEGDLVVGIEEASEKDGGF
jgi:predicted SprT family Zn-dependent metalloprotease